jgi:hypothetical protein
MRFDYYDRLTKDQKALYRKSDAIAAVPIPEVDALRPLVTALEAALGSGKRLATAKAASAFTAALCKSLGAPPVRVAVRLVRPAIRGGELHGLYTYAEKGDAPTIDVWMKTFAHENVVRFRTFLRTLLHEIVHHLDVTILELGDSYHTEGFFKRESSLMRQLVAPLRRKATKPDRPKRAAPMQLGLFDVVAPASSRPRRAPAP